MRSDFGSRKPDIKILLVLGSLLGVALLWALWSRCAIHGLCSSSNQVADNLQSQPVVTTISQPEDSEPPQFMSDVSFSVIIGNQTTANDPSTTRVIKAGQRFFRRESPPNLEWGKRELLIINQKDNWIINLFNKDVLHFESSTQPTTAKVPVAYPSSAFKGELLVGDEVKFFSENNAQKIIEGKEVVYELKIPDGRLRLRVDIATDKPLKIENLNDVTHYRSYSVVYNFFERRRKFDPQLFQPPSGLTIREWDLKAEKQPKYEGWKSEDPALLNYYLKPDPQALLVAFERLPSTGIPEMRQPFIELAGAILKREPTLITSFLRVAKQSNPELQVWAALSLRSCKTADCLTVLKTNPFGFVDEGFKGFLKVVENEEGPQATRRGVKFASIDRYLAEFIVTGEKESLDKILSFLDSRIEITGQGEQSLDKPAALSTAPPGIVDLIKKLALADPSIKTILQSKRDAKSRAATEILETL